MKKKHILIFFCLALIILLTGSSKTSITTNSNSRENLQQLQTDVPVTTQESPPVEETQNDSDEFSPITGSIGLAFITALGGVIAVARLLILKQKKRILWLSITGGFFILVALGLIVARLFNLADSDSAYWYALAIIVGTIVGFLVSLFTMIDKNREEQKLKEFKEKAELAGINKEVLERLNYVDAQIRLIALKLYEGNYQDAITYIKNSLRDAVLEQIRGFVQEYQRGMGIHNLSLFIVDQKNDDTMGFEVLAHTHLSPEEIEIIEKEFIWKIGDNATENDFMSVASYCARDGETDIIQDLSQQAKIFWLHWVDVGEGGGRNGMLYCKPFFQDALERQDGEKRKTAIAILNITCSTPNDGTYLAQFIEVYSRPIVTYTLLYKCAKKLLEALNKPMIKAQEAV